MQHPTSWGLILSGLAAGAINGLLGAGGGMILVPLLGFFTDLKDQEIFSASLAIILPISLVSILVSAVNDSLFCDGVFPWLIGSAAGGILAGLTAKKIPTVWLHRGLGLLIIWGGIRYLCQTPS